MLHLRGDTSAGSAAGTVRGTVGNVETVVQVRQVWDVADVSSDFVGDIAHTFDLLVTR